MAVSEVTVQLGAGLGDRSFPPHLVIGAALLALALGLRVPQQLAMWCCATAWHRFIRRGSPSPSSDFLLNPGPAEDSHTWSMLSAVTLAAGVATALLPWQLKFSLAAYEWMHLHFVWSVPALGVLQGMIALLTFFLPLTLVGLSLSFAHRQGFSHSRWSTSATAWTLIGVGVGLGITVLATQEKNLSHFPVSAASLPFLIATLVASMVRPLSPPTPNVSAKTGFEALPLCSGPGAIFLRAGIVGVGGSAACALGVCFGQSRMEAYPTAMALPPMFMALAVGMSVGCRSVWFPAPSVGGFGGFCILLGLTVAAGTVGMGESGPDRVLPHRTMYPAAAIVGLTLSYGWRALLCRSATRSPVGAKSLAHTLVCCAFTLALPIPVICPWFGVRGTLLLLAFLLLILGGALIVRAPVHAAKGPRLRRAYAAGALVMIICALMWTLR